MERERGRGEREREREREREMQLTDSTGDVRRYYDSSEPE